MVGVEPHTLGAGGGAGGAAPGFEAYVQIQNELVVARDQVLVLQKKLFKQQQKLNSSQVRGGSVGSGRAGRRGKGRDEDLPEFFAPVFAKNTFTQC